MNRAFEAVLAEYDAKEAADEARLKDMPMADRMKIRDELLLHVGADSGRLLHDFVLGMKSKHILELGTSYGYSTLWLAKAAQQTGGRVTTLELSADKQAYAKTMLKKAGLDGYVDLRCGDALSILKDLEGPFDFVLVDLWKDLYIACFDLFRPKLTDGALVIADNMIYPEMWQGEANAYRAHVRALGVDSILLPVGAGIEISRITK